MTAYYLSFSYPDGHVEEVEESFSSLDAAVAYGKNLLNQVRATENIRNDSSEEKLEPHFEIKKFDGENYHIVYRQ